MSVQGISPAAAAAAGGADTGAAAAAGAAAAFVWNGFSTMLQAAATVANDAA